MNQITRAYFESWIYRSTAYQYWLNSVISQAVSTCSKSVIYDANYLYIHALSIFHHFVGEKPFLCALCNKGFNQKNTLQVHMAKHTGLRPYACPLCSVRFTQKGIEKCMLHPMCRYQLHYTVNSLLWTSVRNFSRAKRYSCDCIG